MKPTSILQDSKIMFGLAIILGFLIPSFSHSLKPLVIPILVVMMTFSIKNMGFHHIKKKDVKSIIKLIIINYVFLTGTYLLTTYLFIKNPLFQKALFILGIMPPAIGIISLTYILKGDLEISFLAEFLGYAVSIALIPLLSLLLLGSSVQPGEILKVVFYVIMLPLALSRIIHYAEEKKKLIPGSAVKSIVNLCYGLSFYIIIGLNRDIFLSRFSLLIPVFILLTVLKFGIGTGVFIFLRKKIKRSMDVLYVLFGTLKNGGAGMAITLMLFGVAGTVPFAVNAIITPLYILFIEWLIGVKYS